MSKKLNTSILQFGDIILAGYPGDMKSQMICRFTKSRYSHAMLFGHDSIIHSALAIVTTENPSRQIYEDEDSVCVLRLKPCFMNQTVLEKTVRFARSKIGTLYDRDALKSIVRGRFDENNENKTFCSKFVAEAYSYGGVSLVNNLNSCSPQDIFDSKKLFVVDLNPLLKASEEYVEWANSPNVIKDQDWATIFLFDKVRDLTGSDIVTFQQLFEYVVDHPEDDSILTDILVQSGYLSLWEKEERYSPELYNEELFCKKYKTDAQVMANKIIDDDFQIIRESREMLQYFEECERKAGKRMFFEKMKTLYQNIINQRERRKQELVLTSIFGT